MAPWPTFLALVLAALGATALLVYVWFRAVRRVYRPRSEPASLRRVLCADGWELAVYHRPAVVRRYEQPVVLCHGLASNRFNFDFDPPHSLSHVLAEAGFECFVVEWRGTGNSCRPPPGRRSTDHCVDDHIDLDGPALLKTALAETGASRAFWLGHSMGGLVGYGVAQGPHAGLLQGLVTLGAPVSFTRSWLMRTALSAGVWLARPWGLRHELLSTLLAPFVGYIRLPLGDIFANTRHIPPLLQRKLVANLMSAIGRKTLLQFQDWVENGAFRSFDHQRDYREGLARIEVPLLCTAGSCDRLAPADSVTLGYEMAGSQDKTLVVFGCERGDAQDYGHGDLIFGGGAPDEVYPTIARWLTEHATTVEA